MQSAYKVALAAAAVVVVAVVGYNLLPAISEPGKPTSAPSAQPTVAPNPSPSPASGLKTVTIRPFEGLMCEQPAPSDCIEDPRDDSIAFTYQYPSGWEISDGFVSLKSVSAGPLAWAGMVPARGGSLYSDPCEIEDGVPPDIAVGPTVAEFATALDTHPLLDVTTPVDVTLAGYAGKYLDLRAPADISGCLHYRPITGDTIYAQGSGMRWLFWILDVQGVRVVIEAFDYPGTSAQHQAELQAILDSIEITP